MEEYLRVKQEIKDRIMEALDLTREYTDQEMEELIGNWLLDRKVCACLDISERKRMGKELFYAIRKLDILQELIDDETVTEIMINGMDGIFIEIKGKLVKWPYRFEDRDRLQDVIQQIVSGCNRAVNESSPIVDARLENGSRVNVVLNPVALNGPVVTIRRFPDQPITMQDLITYGSISRQAAEYLQILVKAGYNIMISGGTGSGKTTFLNALSQYIPGEERIITIEDSAELKILGVENLVRLETRNANVDGCRPITIRDLIRTSLRMRPTRVIVGEVRGEEAIDMLQCMNCGHDGSMSTGHANSARDMLTRLETMVLMGMELPLPAIRRQIASGVDIIVHLGRMRDRTRKVLEIAEVTGYEEHEITTRPLFSFEESGEEKDGTVLGTLVRKEALLHVEKLKTAGLYWRYPAEWQEDSEEWQETS